MIAQSSFRLRLAIIVAFSAVALLVHSLVLFRLQGNSCIDDAYISFAYARNLALGHGLVMNLGERVEGYTNFLWVVLMAVVHRLGVDVPFVARILNLALSLVLMVYALLFLALGRRSRFALLAAMIAGGMLAVDGSLARWSQDGMETVLFSLLALVSVCRSIREHETPNTYPLSSLYFAVTTLTRPEGALLFVTSLCFLHGLTDAKIAHAVPVSSMGRGKAGHEKFDLDYSFSKNPTWVSVTVLTRMYFNGPSLSIDTTPN